MIKAIYEAGLSETMYFIFNMIGIIAFALFFVIYGRKQKIKVWKLLVTVIIIYGLAFLWSNLLYKMENATTKSFVRAFIYIPIFALIPAKIFKFKWSTLCDILAPTVCLSHSIYNIACIFPGCCRGYPCNFGIYNKIYDTLLFPTQLLEVFVIFCLFIIFLILYKKHAIPAGKGYPIMLIAFGLIRFFLEFARMNQKIIFGISSVGLHSLFMIFVGILSLIIIRQIQKRKSIKDALGNNKVIENN